MTLGSLRDRQDYMIFEGLLSPYANGGEKPAILYETALKRIRQLAAHEVGHTLGLGHNYYDSTKGWISVMDYPHPLEELKADGTIDLTQRLSAAASATGTRSRSTTAIASSRRAPTRQAALTKILDEAWAQDLRYLTNQDTDAHPKVDQWSNGVNQADELNRMMKIRRAALDRIGEHTIRNGAADGDDRRAARADLHVSPLRGGVGCVDGRRAGLHLRACAATAASPTKWEPAADQRKALDALAATLKPSELTIPKQMLDAIPPRPPGWGRHRELFPRTTGDTFDPLTPATVAVGRDDRLHAAARSRRAHGGAARRRSGAARPRRSDRSADEGDLRAPVATTSYEAEVRRAEERVLVDRLTWLATAAPNPQVRAIASLKLSQLATRFKTAPGTTDADRAQHMLMAADIKRFLERPAEPTRMMAPPDAPPGAPIGDTGNDWLAAPPWYSQAAAFSCDYWEEPPM